MPNMDSILAQLNFAPGAPSTVAFDPVDMVKELRAYGEVDAADQIVKLNPEAIRTIGALAHKHYSASTSPMLDTAICLGIVEFLEGKTRPLKRKRRVYAKGEK